MDQFKGQPRLPSFVIPKRYDLTLKPDLVQCIFCGTVAIEVNVVSQTRFIVLNSADLAIDESSVSFTTQDSKVMRKPHRLETVEADEILIIEFDDALPAGTGQIKIKFEGVLNDKMKGFYRSTYEMNGKSMNMAVTQFEPADARRCFPCWDEPACKASFKITLVVPSHLVALSNMPIAEETVDGSLKTISYQESPVMSTYLVAVVVGMFDYLEDFTSDGVKVRVYCQTGKASQGKFALQVAVKTLDFFKEYFDQPYALPKMDMIAIPDFAAGAMENYGLVTYRETAMLYDEKHSAASNKQRVATVVAHELAHQWFGNLVTMEWWTHLWLNEGFATWVSYLATDHVFPEWNIWTQLLEESSEGLRLDGLEESHPIEVEVNHASEIDEIFDAISYRKGASVIQMLQTYLGAEVFQRALAAYIKRHAWSNAKTEDLWAVLEEISGEPVNKLMNSWTRQKGYPVVTLSFDGDKFEFKQSQFLSCGSPGDGQWIVPITICCGSYDKRKNFLLQSKTHTIAAEELFGSMKANNAWIKINTNHNGFYRVKYSDSLLCRLQKAIKEKHLTETDRFGILDDGYALCMAGQQSLTSFLSLLNSYIEEGEYIVLSNMVTISSKVIRIVADAAPQSLELLYKFFIRLFREPLDNVGWDAKEGESHSTAMLRGELIKILAVCGDDLTLNEASRRFELFMDNRNTLSLPPDIRMAVYVAIMKRVTTEKKEGLQSLLRVYRESDLSFEKTCILRALASCPDPNIILEVLNFLMSSEVRNQDVIFGLSISHGGREVGWQWLQENWEYIFKTWGAGFLLTSFVNLLASQFSSMEKAKEVEAFFAKYHVPSVGRTIKQSIERIHINANWVNNVADDTLRAFFDSQNIA